MTRFSPPLLSQKFVCFRRVPTINVYNHKTKLYFFYDWRDFAGTKPTRARLPIDLVDYFNSIRELAGTRRLVEDDIRTRLISSAP